MMFGAQTVIVDSQGRPTRELIAVLSRLTGTSTTGLDGRVTNLETSVASLATRMTAAEGAITTLQATVSAQAVLIAANAAVIAELAALSVFVDAPWQ